MTNNCCQEQNGLEGNSLNMPPLSTTTTTTPITGTGTTESHRQPLVTVSQGQLRGVLLKSRSGRPYSGFLGIPYAKEPERFELASPAEKWEGVRDATEYGARCIQKDSISKQVWGSENCLFLNVFSPKTCFESNSNTPEEKPLLPVIVFIHGGAFLMGSGDEYSGVYLLDKDVILVTLNYRLGIFGFLNTEDGLVEENLGLKDQLLALEWVQENIINFGGDPARVTLMGQSAGSACVHYHILSPASRGLFSGAIMQSGTALSPWSYQAHPMLFVKVLAEQLKGPVNDTKEMLAFFKSLDARVLAAGDYDYEEWKSKVPTIFAPSKEFAKEGKNMFLSDSPWNLISSTNVNRMPLLMGMTAQEGLNRAGPVLHSESLLQRFNKTWNMMAPLNLMYRTAPVNKDEISDKVNQFYFDSKPISMDGCKDRLIDLFSDRYFFCDIFKSAGIHAKLNDDQNLPVFMYMFGYQGDNSMLNLNGIHQIMGVSHSDDLQYIFDTTLFPLGLKKGSESVEVSKQMVNWIAQFATHRDMSSLNPMSSDSEAFKPWLPVRIQTPIIPTTTKTKSDEEEESCDKTQKPNGNSISDSDSDSTADPGPLQYYFIDVKGEMTQQSEDLRQRIRFWDSILPVGGGM